MNDTNELRRLAEAASIGPWEQGDGENDIRVYCDDALGTCVAECAAPMNSMPRSQRVANMAYIAACSPDVVLALLSELGERDVGIKPLEWATYPLDGRTVFDGRTRHQYILRAKHPFGCFYINRDPDGAFWLSANGTDEGARIGSENEAKAAAQADYEARIRSALVPSSERDALRDRVAELEGAATHRHKKRGSTYTLIGVGKMQAENWEVREYGATDEPVSGPSVDMEEVAIYRSVDDGALWVRPIKEFEDGRFEALSHGDQP